MIRRSHSETSESLAGLQKTNADDDSGNTTKSIVFNRFCHPMSAAYLLRTQIIRAMSMLFHLPNIDRFEQLSGKFSFVVFRSH